MKGWEQALAIGVKVAFNQLLRFEFFSPYFGASSPSLLALICGPIRGTCFVLFQSLIDPWVLLLVGFWHWSRRLACFSYWKSHFFWCASSLALYFIAKVWLTSNNPITFASFSSSYLFCVHFIERTVWLFGGSSGRYGYGDRRPTTKFLKTSPL